MTNFERTSSEDSHAGPSCVTGPTLRSGQKHSLFYWEFVEFQVQDVLFQLPLRPFVKGSKTFAAAHGLVPRDDESNPGTKVQRTPIKLDVGLREFEAFLKVLLAYTPTPSLIRYSPHSKLSKEDWLSALRLATSWFFNDIRSIIIVTCHPDIPNRPVLSATEKVMLARELKIPQWLIKGYAELAAQIAKQPLTVDEATEIGLATCHELNGIVLRRYQENRPVKSASDVTKNDIMAVGLFKSEHDLLKEESGGFTTNALVQEVVPNVCRREARSGADSGDAADAWGADTAAGEWGADAAAPTDWAAPAEGDAAVPDAEGDAKREGRPRREREPEEDDYTITLEQYLAQQKEKDTVVPKLEGTRRHRDRRRK
ncbi:hypothetical protein BKA70DRAFT_1407492 [Coprinopsis sp. MPI-PUGE-AT-0042]|nr:hypothetical protein BKA70DRAFT_1407492 [Coprinopsis sp. MPI-PUGE-AT-0042]